MFLKPESLPYPLCHRIGAASRVRFGHSVTKSSQQLKIKIQQTTSMQPQDETAAQ